MLVKLRRNNFESSGEEFVLTADRVDRNMSNNLVTRTVLGAAGDVAGKDINLDTESFTIGGWIRSTDPDSYPDYTDTDTSKWKHSTAKERALAEAVRRWGPTVGDGFDTLVWGPRERSGMLSSYRVTEDASSRPPEQYDITIEWTHTNVFIDDQP